MDINEAALRLKELEILQSQITHLQDEAARAISIDYCEDCHMRANDLLLAFFDKAVD